jgi:hypothetical protein
MKPVRDCTTLRLSFAPGDVPNSSEQPTKHWLDEEALSRLDDEGGSNDPAVNSPVGPSSPGGDADSVDSECEFQWL